MRTLRTPKERFSDLPDFGYEIHYAEVPDGDGASLRMAYVAIGRDDEAPVVLLHGELSWSFLYRSVIPPLVDAGLRVVAPDLVGFGRSDKPTEQTDHTYARHVEWVRALLFDVLDLRDVTLVGQDWGGLIGLRLAAEHPARFARIVASNTGLPTGDQQLPEVWWEFRRAVERTEMLDIGRLVANGCITAMSVQTRAAYDAPFPDETYKAGPRVMPTLVPTRQDDPAAAANRRAWAALSSWDKPFLVAFSDGDPITGPMAAVLRRAVPGASGIDHAVIEGAGHFLQEDAGQRLGEVVAGFVRRSPIRRRT